MLSKKAKSLLGGILLLGLVQNSLAASTASSNALTHKAPSKHASKVHKHKTKKGRRAKKRYKAKAHSADYMQGVASYYSLNFAGRRTSSGKPLHVEALTAAHPTLPLGTKLKVTSLVTGKVVYVEVNDRMPRRSGHVIDLTPSGAKLLGIYPHGVSKVRLEVVDNTEFWTHEAAELAQIDNPQQSPVDVNMPLLSVPLTVESQLVTKESGQ